MLKLILTVVISLFVVLAQGLEKKQVTGHKQSLEIFEIIRCMVCQGESIKDSSSEFAANLKRVVIEQLDSGYTKDEIIKYLKNKYGDEIILEPSLQESTLLLWISPFLLVTLGLVAIVTKNHKNNSHHQSKGSDTPSSDSL